MKYPPNLSTRRPLVRFGSQLKLKLVKEQVLSKGVWPAKRGRELKSLFAFAPLSPVTERPSPVELPLEELKPDGPSRRL